MESKHPYLLKIIDVDNWQQLQDSLANVTGMAIITVDYKGVPITHHSNRQMFCSLVRGDPELSRHCQKCDSRGGLEATRLGRPYIYLCHYNILDAAIPILVDHNYVGAVLVGEVLPSSERETQELETICLPSNRKLLEKQTQQYDEYYEALPRVSLARVKMVVDLLFHLCNYIVSEAVEKNLALELVPRDKQGHVPVPADVDGYPLRSLENIKQKIDNAITDAHIRETTDMGVTSSNPILQPAFDYMNTHKNEKCSLKQIAAICHVSPSYFSRLFARETSETFSSYVTRSKIGWAKHLLENTDRTISQVGADVGFCDAGHFIKTFKKHEGVTPSRYRKFVR